MEGKYLVRGPRKELGTALNFARYWLPTLLPDLNRRLCFLDDDTIVQGVCVCVCE